MSDYILSCCSPVDITTEHLDKLDVKYTFFHYELHGKQYIDDFGKTMSYEDLYSAMSNGAKTKTSQVSVGEYIEYLSPYLHSGKDVFHVCLSSGISGTYNSAILAKNLLEDQFPDRKIYIIDSLNASSGYGLLIDKLANLKNNGMTIDELFNWYEKNKYKQNSWFFTSDLTFLIRGGRVPKVAGTIGSALNICPIFNINYEGKLIPTEKVRTKKKVIKRLVSIMEEYAENGNDYNGKCFISHSVCPEDAQAVADLIKDTFPHLDGDIIINNIGSTIGSHTGPGTVALFFWGKERQQ